MRAHRHRALSTVRSARTHPYVRRIATSSGLCEPIAGMIGDDLVRSLMSPHTTAARVLFCFGRRVISGSRPLASSRCVGVRGERWRRPSCTCMHAAGAGGLPEPDHARATVMVRYRWVSHACTPARSLCVREYTSEDLATQQLSVTLSCVVKRAYRATWASCILYTKLYASKQRPSGFFLCS